MQSRVVRPEILDTLEPDDPGAVANRRDLRFLNRFMGNWAWIARQVRKYYQPGRKIVEIGAGEGDLGRYLFEKIPELQERDYTGLDLWQRPPDWPEAGLWRQEDLLTASWNPGPDLLVSNLLLHQFEDGDLKALGEKMAHLPVWIINEPLRVGWAVWGLAAMRPFGLHPVSWHDGRVSIGAGFRGREIADLLGADRNGRKCKIVSDIRGAYRMVSWLEN
ncbi:class I SAM-dependent methyltransferase [Puniceicoccus vermicola]|uniref:Class I SAM-dependent methyltransferase n=1 Tax=Puniceicoccus vermicola TaxID=388746 RepID=A0A7X1AXP0_9BACT|nr:hypothetical protein [Puniceicoccus vermicola]MBC2600883.1 hypothetical protein [Puniceicoccus vermicola]